MFFSFFFEESVLCMLEYNFNSLFLHMQVQLARTTVEGEIQRVPRGRGHGMTIESKIF